MRDHLREHPRLTHATCDQLRVLCPEVDDQNRSVAMLLRLRHRLSLVVLGAPPTWGDWPGSNWPS
ncbi:Uncharacterised protein [Mycobacteroides abscessus subsp. abscessus]|nr:Uncharacterised protein [Mycobacteroides abscessus subsp. abscessus]